MSTQTKGHNFITYNLLFLKSDVHSIYYVQKREKNFPAQKLLRQKKLLKLLRSLKLSSLQFSEKRARRLLLSNCHLQQSCMYTEKQILDISSYELFHEKPIQMITKVSTTCSSSKNFIKGGKIQNLPRGHSNN